MVIIVYFPKTHPRTVYIDFLFSLILGEETNYLTASNAISSRIEWTPQLDRCLIDLMLEQVQKGNMIDSAFNQQAWDNMLKSFSETLGLQCDKTFLEDRNLWFKNQYDGVSKILSCSGFAWDETRHKVIADNDVWEAYIKVHKIMYYVSAAGSLLVM